MLKLFRAAWTVFKTLFSMLAFIGLIGGLFADVPGIQDDATVNGILSFFSRFLKIILYVIGHYPDGVLLLWVALSILVWFLDEVPLQKRKIAFNEKRQNLANKQRNKGRRRGK
jgi:hypothetical protein